MTTSTAEKADPVAPRRPRPRLGRFTGLLFATGSSITANAMVLVLVPWLVLSRTDSAAQAGLVATVSFAAAIPALLIGGPLIDRLGRRRVAVGADLLSALSVAALPLVDATLGLSFALTLVLIGVGALFDAPGAAAREASRPDVAARSGLSTTSVNAGGEATEGTGQVLGPALAGIGIGLVGVTESLWVAALLLAIAAVVTWFALPADLPRDSGGASGGIFAGIRLLFADAVLRSITVLTIVAVLFFTPLSLVITVHAQQVGDPALLAVVSACIAIGAIVGAIGYGAIASRLRRRSVLIAGLAVFAAGIAGLAFAVAVSAPLAVLALVAAATGLGIGPLNPVLAATLQERTSPEIRGRAIAASWSLSLLSAPLGTGLSGVLLELVGVAATLGVVAVGLAVVSVAAASAPSLRRLELSR